MRALRFLGVTAAVLGIIGFLLSQVPLAVAQAPNTNPQPVATGCQVGTASSQCIAANPSRKSIQICNPSASIVVWIAPNPTTAAANGGGSVSIAPVSSNVTSCFTPPTGAGGNTTNVGAQWNAIAVTTPTSLTIYEYQ